MEQPRQHPAPRAERGGLDASATQPRQRDGRFGTLPVQEADGGMAALEDPIDRYNAEGSLRFPPRPRSAEQVRRFWLSVPVPDDAVGHNTDWYNGALYRHEDAGLGGLPFEQQPDGSEYRLVFRLHKMLLDSKFLPEPERQALRATPIEVAPGETATLDELDRRWLLSATNPNAGAPGTEWMDENDRNVWSEINEKLRPRSRYEEVRDEERMRMYGRDDYYTGR
ncbi:hypothetical protein [Isoptericola croceus]|uniref:hypothetical protein n=1 Tax=Isoptericola croceus TaxID=3031406 RepID=UPI0023F7A30F|nr:hypothetical protein [Isoptericola croceus]